MAIKEYEWEYLGVVGSNQVPDAALPAPVRAALDAVGQEAEGHAEWHAMTTKGLTPEEAPDVVEALRSLVRGRRVTVKLVGGQVCMRRWNGGRTAATS